MMAQRCSPGTRVTVTYRVADGHGCPGHIGTILAQNDPRAWTGSIAFGGRTPTQQEVDTHLAKPAIAGVIDASRVPIAWDFGKIYWEPVSAVRPASEAKS